MMITGYIRFVPRPSLTNGNRRARTIRSAGSPYFLSTVLLSPSLHRRAVAEEAARAEHQHHDQDGEDHDLRPPDADVLVAHGAYYPDEYAPHNGAGEVADAAQNRRREREQTLGEAHVEDGDAVEEAVHYARGPGQDAAQQEGDRDGAVDVDADHRRRLFILGDGAHRLALLGTPDKVGEGDEQRYRHGDDEKVLVAEDDLARPEDVGAGDEVGEGNLGRPLPDEPHVLQDKRHAYRRDQDREPRRIPQ